MRSTWLWRFLLVLSFYCTVSCSQRSREDYNLSGFDVRQSAPFIAKHLYRGPLAGVPLSAVTETEKPFENDDWFWTDDNAKGLEALTLPEIFPDFLAQVGEMTRFVIANSPPPFVFRRRVNDRLEIKDANPANVQIATGLMNFHGNLRNGELRQSYRFHDGRTEDAACFGGDHVSFMVNGKSYSGFLRDSIVATEVRKTDEAIFLGFTSELRARKKSVGTVNLKYEIRRGKPYVAYQATLVSMTEHGLSDVILSSSFDQLDVLSSIRYSNFFAFNQNASPTRAKAASEPTESALHRGPTEWWAIAQDGTFGFSYGNLVVPDSPSQILDISSTSVKGAFHRVVTRYRFNDIVRGASSTIGERRILMAGGLYRDMATYAPIVNRLDDFTGLDLSISYDIGAELNGVAAAYFADKQRIQDHPGAQPVAYLASTKKWFDQILESYTQRFLEPVNKKYPFVFPRGHAFVLMAVETMFRATGESRYRDQIETLASILTKSQSNGGAASGGFYCMGETVLFDCHAASIIALGRAVRHTKNPAYVQAIMRGLYAYGIDPNGKPGHDVYVRMNGGTEKDTYFWSYKAGLLLRSLDGIEANRKRDLMKLTRDDVAKIAELRKHAIAYLSKTLHRRGNLNEYYTSVDAGETNSETQSWVALGLYRIEALISERQQSITH